MSAPLMLIGSELHELAALKAHALAELEDGIALYRNRHNRFDKYFGLLTQVERLPGRTLYKLYWHDNNPADHSRKGLIAAIRQEEQFIEVVGAVLAKMAWTRNRQKAFKFQPEAKTA